MTDERKAALVFEDGSVYLGIPFGAEVEAAAEVVFNTALTGYQEICTDPSYRGQMVVMTHPQIGNYGISSAVEESARPWLAALIAREISDEPHHWASQSTLDAYLKHHRVPGLKDVDTRAITRRLRTSGTLRGVLRQSQDEAFSPVELQRMAEQATHIQMPVLVGEVSGFTPERSSVESGPRIAVIDCGTKWSILRELARRGANTVSYAWDSSPDSILAASPDGVVIANGPGDPAMLDAPVRLAQSLLERGVPTLGICLGHQIIGRAAGAETSRLPFGHHGANHPVRDERTGRVYITSQNHEFQVTQSPALERAGFTVSHRSLNDDSVEGLVHGSLPVRTVQFHPEGAPGPRDAGEIFDEFLALVTRTAGRVP